MIWGTRCAGGSAVGCLLETGRDVFSRCYDSRKTMGKIRKCILEIYDSGFSRYGGRGDKSLAAY